jgi:ABC-type branched-subunit amino acid transport system ATPase component
MRHPGPRRQPGRMTTIAAGSVTGFIGPNGAGKAR